MKYRFKIKGYHATNKRNYNNIMENGFYISKNTESKSHWLGNGIYLFKYPKDAESWSKDIKNCKKSPMTLLVEAEIEKEKYLDLDNPENMNKLQTFIQLLMETIYYNDIERGEIRFRSELHLISWGLNEYKSTLNIDLVKYTFENSRTSNFFEYNTYVDEYFHEKTLKGKFNWLTYSYNEVQLCLTDNKNIINIEKYS